MPLSPLIQETICRPWEITGEYQEYFGYPAVTDEIKRKVLGLNALRLHNVDPITAPCPFTRDKLERIRLEIPSGLQTYGPGTNAERDAFVTAHRGLP